MATKATSKYIEAVGRRKTAIARVRMTEASKNSFDINGKVLSDYFPLASDQKKVEEAITTSELGKTFSVSVKVQGSGVHSQAEAIRLGIARILIKLEPESRKVLKKAGFLKRDPRAKERRKFGLKKARKAPQWSKR
jgi:small subunit ribosomal protein S9